MAGVFDSQQAASYLGYPKTGYGALVSEICGIDLPKSTANTIGAPAIDHDALAYAVDDVRHLPTVCQTLQKPCRSRPM